MNSEPDGIGWKLGREWGASESIGPSRRPAGLFEATLLPRARPRASDVHRRPGPAVHRRRRVRRLPGRSGDGGLLHRLRGIPASPGPPSPAVHGPGGRGRPPAVARPLQGPGRRDDLHVLDVQGHLPAHRAADPRRARRPRHRRPGRRRERRSEERHGVQRQAVPRRAADDRAHALRARHRPRRSSASGTRTASPRSATGASTPPTSCSSTAAGCSGSAGRSTGSRPRASRTTSASCRPASTT